MQDKYRLNVPFYESPNHGLNITPKIIVINFTKSRTLMSSVRWMTSNDSKASTHLIIGRDGKTAQLVPLNVKAWHCGASQYRGTSQCNDFSIGIELCNWGDVTYKYGMYQTFAKTILNDDDVVKMSSKIEPSILRYWERYPDIQVQECLHRCREICRVFDIEAVVGHDDICVPVGRSLGPGPAFPMDLIHADLGRLYDNSQFLADLHYHSELMSLRNDMAAILRRVNRFIERRDD